MRHRWILVLALALLVGPAPTWAGDAPPDVQQAEAVLAALRSGDAAALKKLAAQAEPDPWVVAWRLCRQGETAAAQAFAKATSGPAHEALAAYVRDFAAPPVPDPAMRAFEESRAAYAESRWTDVLSTIPDDLRTPDLVLQARLSGMRATALRLLERYGEALPPQVLAAEAAEKAGWLTRAADSLDVAGHLARATDDMAANLGYWRRRLAIEERLARGEPLAESRANMASLLLDAGETQAALELGERAVAAARASGAQESLGVALEALGGALRQLGQTQRALETLREGAALQHARGDKSMESKAWSRVGDVLRDAGDPVGARAAFEQALEVGEASGDLDRVAEALGGLGSVDGSLGLFERALPALRRACELMEKAGDGFGLVSSLQALGITLAAADQDEEAEVVLQRAVRLTEGSPFPSQRIFVRLALVILHGNRANFPAMLELAEKALAEAERADEGVARVLLRTYVGRALSGLGRHEQAVAALGEARRDAQAQQLTDNEVHALETLALALDFAGRNEEALQAAQEAVRVGSSLAATLSDEESAAHRSRRHGTAAMGTLSAAKLGRVGETLRFLELGRGGALLQALGGRRQLGAATLPPALLQAESQARAAGARAARMQREAAARGDAAARTAAEQARASAEAALLKAVESIQREQKRLAAVLYPEPATSAELRALLGPGDALVVIGLLEKRSLAVVLSAKDERLVWLGDPAAIRRAAESLRRTADAGQELAQLRTELDALVAALITPLALGPEVRRVVISPDGPLAYLPWSLLVGEREVALVPSATTWQVLRAGGATRGEGVLALGDPEYGAPRDARAVALLRSGAELLPLPATREEARRVGQVVLLGAQATEVALREALAKRPSWRAVHLACHGLVDPEHPARSSLALSVDPDNDGFLTALEVTRLHVPANLVVLSACDTGRGRVRGGEGLMGLARSFMLAGAERVLVSLWKVDDSATLLLMERFYGHWKPGVAASRALALAQRDVREHTVEAVDPVQSRAQGKDVRVRSQPYAAPAFWAGWVLWGRPD